MSAAQNGTSVGQEAIKLLEQLASEIKTLKSEVSDSKTRVKLLEEQIAAKEGELQRIRKSLGLPVQADEPALNLELETEAPVLEPDGAGASWRLWGSAEIQSKTAMSGSFDQPIMGGGTDLDSDFLITHVHTKFAAKPSRNVSYFGDICFSHDGGQVSTYELQATYRLTDNAALTAGRFLLPFGRYHDAHEPTQRATLSRPLMYLGHEERELVPIGGPRPFFVTPLPDNGFCYDAESGNWRWRAFATTGLAGTSDIDWMNDETVGDNNNNKSLGARLEHNGKNGLSLGASFMTGKYDPENARQYVMRGLDVLWSQTGKWQLQAEYATSNIDSSEATGNYKKRGWYGELTVNAREDWEWFFSYSHLDRKPAFIIQNLDKYGIGVCRKLPDGSRIKLEYSVLNLGGFAGDANDPNATQYGTSFTDIKRLNLSVSTAF
jgi:hypothetical protein